MYNIKLTNYVPEPKPATTDRIVAAHYYAAWKKGAAGIHNGFDDLHEYPERTPLMGYYDEENPEVCDWEIKWAVEHGINCFIQCWYRKLENMGKPITVNDLRCGHGLHEALFNAKYQKMMKFAIMFENSPRWGTTDAVDAVENLMPFWTEQYFKRDNYLKIDNKPVVFVFYQERLKEVFQNPENFTTGGCLDLMLHPSTVSGEEGLDIFYSLISMYFANGGPSMHFNVFDAEKLKDTQAHPEKYQNLQVRVCGWNVQWNNLTRAEQDAYILRAENIVE